MTICDSLRTELKRKTHLDVRHPRKVLDDVAELEGESHEGRDAEGDPGWKGTGVDPEGDPRDEHWERARFDFVFHFGKMTVVY